MIPNWARYELEKNLLNELKGLKGGKCINIGCGISGRYSELLKKFDIDGVDIIPVEESLNLPYKYYQVDAKSLPFHDNIYDLGIAIESFEHIPENISAMSELFRVMKKECMVIITTPTLYTWIFEFGKHGPHYYTKQNLIDLVQGSGLTVIKEFKCGGLGTYSTNLFKSWLSYIGLRLFPKKWWLFIDIVLKPFYIISYYFIDKIFPILPSNWFLIAKK